MSVLRGGRSPGSDRDDVFSLRRFSSEGREGDLVDIESILEERLLLVKVGFPTIATGMDARFGLSACRIRVQLRPYRTSGMRCSCCQGMKQEAERKRRASRKTTETIARRDKKKAS